MTDELPTGILLDAPIGPASKPEEIRAWIDELDQIETTVAPNSDATVTIARARKTAKAMLEFAESRPR